MSFSTIYKKAVEEISTYFPSDISALSRHNLGWRSEKFDPTKYLFDSEARYVRAYEVLKKENIHKVLDVGGFLGAFPLALERMGFQVSIAEKFGYYDNALDEVKHFLEANQIGVIDIDFTDSTEDLKSFASSFDGVTCMAVAEHLAHSPKALMDNIRSVLVRNGVLIFEVPNLAFWPIRYSFFFKGKTVMSPIENVYHSSIPFTGHHREYTLNDARYVAKEGGFSIIEEDTFNYSIEKNNLLQAFKYAPAFIFKEWAEVIMLHCRKTHDAQTQ